MLTIGKTYLVRENGAVRLCADVSAKERGTTLWFSLPQEQERFLTRGRADPFVVALLPMAMREGCDLCCEEAMSARLRHGLGQYLIPTLSKLPMYKRVCITAPTTNEKQRGLGAVGTGFSGGVDSLYTVMRHKDGPYSLTHAAVFNTGVFEGVSARENFNLACGKAKKFALEQKLDTVFLDTNLSEALQERFLDVYSFRNLACALALQGLFSIYLLSSGHDFAHFQIDGHNSASYDLLTVASAATESMAFYLSGGECNRVEKLYALSEWEPSYGWLHPCVYGRAGEKNCGHCKKCARDMTTLYALGALEKYGAVFNAREYRKYLPQRLGFVMANRGNHLYDETLRLLQERNTPIPSAAYLCEKQFKAAMERLETQK